MSRPALRQSMRRQRGLAALAIVMVLLFVMAMVAAYTNRNLIFEQRTAANYFRSTQIFEVAQSGVDWGTAMVNGARIQADCTASANVADTSFRDRYLAIDGASGFITPLDKAGGGRRSSACVFNGATWNCSCPTDADPAPVQPAGAGPYPAFRVRFVPIAGSTSPGFVRMEVVGCPRLDLAPNGCLDFDNTSGDEGRQFISVLLGLHSAVKTVPAAALTVRGNIAAPAATMRAYNADVPAAGARPSGGFAVQTGGLSTPGITDYSGAPGTPPEMSLATNDGSLNGLTRQPPLLPTPGDRMFSNMFGLRPLDYQQQPALAQLFNCPCNAAALRAAIQQNPGRAIWVNGDLTLDSAGNIGDPNAPVVVVATGDITAPVAVNFYGVLYSRAPQWDIAGTLNVVGAAVAETDLAGTGNSSFVYDAAVLQRARVTTGSLVPVSGTWKDFLQ